VINRVKEFLGMSGVPVDSHLSPSSGRLITSAATPSDRAVRPDAVGAAPPPAAAAVAVAAAPVPPVAFALPARPPVPSGRPARDAALDAAATRVAGDEGDHAMLFPSEFAPVAPSDAVPGAPAAAGQAAPGAPVAAVPPGSPVAPVSIADAFAAFFAEEQGETPPTVVDGTYELGEQTIDRIAARVAERLTRGLLGEQVTRVVTDVSERLVRDEIDRIRAAAKTHES
jgi:hypothetical protein